MAHAISNWIGNENCWITDCLLCRDHGIVFLFGKRTVPLAKAMLAYLIGLVSVYVISLKLLMVNCVSCFIPLFQAIESVFFTVVASPNLPVHICSEERADEVYSKHAGTELLGVRFISKCELLISPYSIKHFQAD